jgi:mannose-6-phosphate isomerase-like protein (cupin superfamily)
MAAPSRGSDRVCTWKLTVAPGHDTPEPHTLDATEIFMVSSGTVRVTPGGEAARAGDTVVVQAGQPIQLANAGDGPAEVYVAIAAGFTGTLADGSTVRPPWAE